MKKILLGIIGSTLVCLTSVADYGQLIHSLDVSGSNDGVGLGTPTYLNLYTGDSVADISFSVGAGIVGVEQFSPEWAVANVNIVMTDGNDDLVQFEYYTDSSYYVGSSIFGFESQYYGNSPNSANEIDFDGYEIKMLSFTLTSFEVEFYEADGYSNNPFYTYSGTYSIYGEVVPEPSSIAMIGLVSGCAVFIRRRLVI